MKRILGHPRFPLAAVALALSLSLPALGNGFRFDDHYHRLALLRGQAQGYGNGAGVSDLFSFAVGDPALGARAIEDGVVPWWTFPGLKLAFFRPLSALTHQLD